MQEGHAAPAEAGGERGTGLHLIGEARIVQMQPAECSAQILELRGIDWEQAAEHDLLRGLEAGQRLGGAFLLVGQRVADLRVGYLLEIRGDEAGTAGAERL